MRLVKPYVVALVKDVSNSEPSRGRCGNLRASTPHLTDCSLPDKICKVANEHYRSEHDSAGAWAKRLYLASRAVMDSAWIHRESADLNR